MVKISLSSNICTKRLKVFFVFLFLLGFYYSLSAQILNWEVITNKNNMKSILIQNDTLYAASSGGFIRFPVNSENYQTLTSENDLTDHNFTTLSNSTKNSIVLGTINGVLTFFNNRDQSFYEDHNIKGNEILSIHSVEDTLWLIIKDLVAVYLYDANVNRYRFKDFFTNFNLQFDSFEDIFYHDKYIWVASDNGLLYAPGNFLRYNLKAASSWNMLTTDNGLPSNQILSLSAINDTLIIGTNNGLSKFFNQNIVNISSGLLETSIKHIKIRNGKIYVDNSQSIYILQGDHFMPLYDHPENSINDFDLTSDGKLWISLIDKGLRNISDNRKVWFNGPIDNGIGQPLLDSQGRLWIVTGAFKDQREKGFSVRLNDGTWQNYRYITNWRPTSSTQTIMEDETGNIWIGSWNGGLIIIDPELNFYHFNNYTNPSELWVSSYLGEDTVTCNPPDSVRHFLSYTKDSEELLVVTDVILDKPHQSIWLSTYYVNSNRPIIRYDGTFFNSGAFNNSNWEDTALNINDDKVAALTLDIFNNLWIGTEESGVLSMQFSSSGSISWLHYDESNNLKNNKCLAIAGDQDGYVWLGTQAGLNAYFNGNLFDFRENYQPIGLRINDIFIDSQNNKWFATDKGLSLLKAQGSPWSGESWIHFVPKTSELFGDRIYRANLPNEEIRKVFVDQKTGDVYCGTMSGLAILRSNPFTTPLTDLNKLKVGPSPLVLEDGINNYIFFYNLTGNCEIKILTISGRLVRALSQSNSSYIMGSLGKWDGKNENGVLVSSGVYLYMITDENGNTTSGKFLVIHK